MRWLKIAAAVCVAVLLMALIAGWWVYRAVHRPVPWYDELLVTEYEVAEAAGDEMEKRTLALVSDVKRPHDRWAAVFTDDEVNGWLAVDLAEKYADALPAGVSEPRIAMQEGGARFACRYDGPQLSTVFNLDADIYLTGERNVVAVRIRGARAGSLPLPLGRLFEEATSEARRRGIVVDWMEQAGDPVALLTVPDEHRGVPGRLLLETLVLREGEIYLAGRTEPSPRGE